MSRKKKRFIVLLIVCGILFCILLGVMIYSLVQVIDYEKQEAEIEDVYEEIIEQYQIPDPEIDTAANEDPEEADVSSDGTYTGGSVNTSQISHDYSDYCGWLSCPGTVINYPVMQGPDNQYYLNHLMNGYVNRNGSLFISYTASRDPMESKNTVIFGHNMRYSGSMFGTLQKWKGYSWYQNHPTFYYDANGTTYTLDVVAAYTTTMGSEAFLDNFYDDQAFLDYIADAKSKTGYSTSAQVEASDHIITLSTCAYEFENARFVVVCKIK